MRRLLALTLILTAAALVGCAAEEPLTVLPTPLPIPSPTPSLRIAPRAIPAPYVSVPVGSGLIYDPKPLPTVLPLESQNPSSPPPPDGVSYSWIRNGSGWCAVPKPGWSYDNGVPAGYACPH